MKYLSARQAWHDCFYAGIGSVSAEMMRIGEERKHDPVGYPKQGANTSTTARWKSNDGKCWHQVQAGRVQMAISRLPAHIRAFGMLMYAPASYCTAAEAEVAHASILSIVCSKVEQRQREGKWRRVHYLAWAALNDYRRQVFGGPAMFKGPAEICAYILDEFGESIPDQHWKRDRWPWWWNELGAACDEMEMAALTPIADEIFDNAA